MSAPFSTVTHLTISEDDAGQRIDNFLLRTLKKVPKPYVYKIIRRGEVRISGKRIRPDYRLQAGDNLRIPPIKGVEEMPAKTFPSVKKGGKAFHTLESCILYEDKDFLVLNKPSGMATHGGSGISWGVIETLRHLRPREKRLELVHRLDKETSGCLLIAKKATVLAQMHALLRTGGMEKTYLALVVGHWPKKLHEIEAPLLKKERSGERVVGIHQEGKEALTKFQVQRYFDKTTLLLATPITGRTHQIRVHAASAGHPIVCDDKYGDKTFNKEARAAGCKRLFLHARSLKFQLPGIEKPFYFTAPLDTALEKVLNLSL